MKKQAIFSIVLLSSLLSLSQSPQANSQAAQEEQFQIRRENFESGRQLLLQKGVPFDPDELLRDEWSSDLKAKLNSLPEMRETRYEKAPLKGAYLADTLYLPEKVELTGHTLILANYVVFEGKNPIIKGNFDLHFFPTRPVTVLGDTLANLLQKRPELLNVRLGKRPSLPSFLQIKDLIQPQPHMITFDTSGAPPQAARYHNPNPAPRVRRASWSPLEMLLPMQTSKNCSTSCDNSGGAGSPGSTGNSPAKQATGNPNGGKGADGSCAVGSNSDGANGFPGGDGGQGDDAGDGGQGGQGFNAGNINVYVIDGDTNQYTFTAIGGQGGQGGPGGTGGTGGDGGAGQTGGNGVTCNCIPGKGGNGGQGGTAGTGGKGGNGGPGGPGGSGGTITGSIPYNGSQPLTSNGGGQGGSPGDAGQSGFAGNPGSGGTPGVGALDCMGNRTNNGNFLGGGNVAGSRGSGNFGTWGPQGPNGPSPSISKRAQPPTNGCLTVSPGTGQVRTPANGCSPIIIDTEGEGFHLTSALSGVSFDITGTGQAVQMGWTDSHFHNAFLALPGADGLVHDGKELFGDFTPQPLSDHPNGFLALAEYDKPENGGNGDGIIDQQDAVFSKLRLWIDENHDGVCQPNELHRLPEFGIYSLSLKYEESRWTDQFGNQFRYRGRVNPGVRKDPRDETSNGQPGRREYDVFFVTR